MSPGHSGRHFKCGDPRDIPLILLIHSLVPCISYVLAFAYIYLFSFPIMDHTIAVQEISARVSDFHSHQQPFRIYHGTTNSTRPSNRSLSNTVSTKSLTHILEIDINRCTAIVEPNVSMGALVAATKAHGLVPLVVVEFPNISVGGGFSGTSGESSSFREGFFDHTVNWIEMVLADGQVVKAYNDRVETASELADKHSDLFWGTASSFGTLGVVTLLEIRLEKVTAIGGTEILCQF
jgi:FAD/FMN-containing dehydrogenases